MGTFIERCFSKMLITHLSLVDRTQNQTWTTQNITDIVGSGSVQAPGPIAPLTGTPLAAASADESVYQTSVFFIEPDHSVHSISHDEFTQSDIWVKDPRLIPGAVSNTSSLAAAWLPCGDGNCEDGILSVAADFNQTLGLYNSSNWTESTFNIDITLMGPGLALAPRLNNDAAANSMTLIAMQKPNELPPTGSGFF